MPISKYVRGTERRGVGFPIDKGNQGYWSRKNAVALRRTSIAMILGTTPGERVGVPDFGSNIRRLMFEPNDTILVQQLKAETVDAIQRWDPYIAIVGVAVNIDENAVQIFIDFIDLADENQRVSRYTAEYGRS
jgi:phage baseplate assembly protein W